MTAFPNSAVTEPTIEDRRKYVRRVRLHHAHLELVASDPDTTSVTDIARRWGFHQIGLFMRRYTQAYGGEPDTRRP